MELWNFQFKRILKKERVMFQIYKFITRLGNIIKDTDKYLDWRVKRVNKIIHEEDKDGLSMKEKKRYGEAFILYWIRNDWWTASTCGKNKVTENNYTKTTKTLNKNIRKLKI